MKALAIFLAFSMLVAGCDNASGGNSSSSSMTCGHFNGLAGTVTQQDVARISATTEQSDAFKKVVAHHAGMLASAERFSEKGLQFARSKDRLPWLVGNSFEMTRSFCVRRENDRMKDVAIEQFDYLLAAMANPASIEEVREIKQGKTPASPEAAKKSNNQSSAVIPDASIVGVWEGWKNEGELWQTVMNVKRLGADYEVALDVRGPGCIGSIDGTAVLSGDTLQLVKKDDTQVCTISARIDGSSAYISQDNCSYYHGAKCDFSGTLSKAR